MYSSKGSVNVAQDKPVLSGLAAIWRADRLDAKAGTPGHPTGFEALDAELPDRGWPRAGLIEILAPRSTGAEWSLLAPWLRRPASATGAGPILCLDPPHDPYAPALHQLGLPLERLLLVRADTAADTAWAGEQALQVMQCSALLWWVSANIEDVKPAMLRRLHLASTVHPTPVFVFGPFRSRQRSSPAPLRLLLEQANTKLAITVIKRRGPPMIKPIELDRPIFNAVIRSRWQALTASSFQMQTKARRGSSPTAAVDHVLACPAPAGIAA
jgi:protein ImuA